MNKTFSPSYSSSQITYVEAEAVEFSRFRFRFHRKRTASTSSFLFRFHVPGLESRSLFKLINKQLVFLSKLASLWKKNKNYICMKSRLVHLKVVNDFSEKALELVTDYHQSVVTKSQSQKQFLYQVVKNLSENKTASC